jgi:hypothetical protein
LIIGLDKEAEVPVKDIENLFSEIIAEYFLNLGKDMGIYVQEVYYPKQL